jgi:hypothetical protein
MNAKHQFKYTYNDTELEEFSPVEVTFDMPGDVTITQMLWNFECYLKSCGFVFDGHLEVVPEEGYDVIDEDDTYGCMADWDKDETNKSTSCCGNHCEDLGWEGEAVEKFNKNLSKLEAEVKKNKWVHGMCNPPSPDRVKASSLPGWGKHDKVKDPTDNCWNS